MRKIVWICWFQGLEGASDLVRRCIASWKALNPGWEIKCLTSTTIGRYIDLHEHVDLARQTITAASLSDLVRMLLIHEYGGVWADATTVCNRPLDDWLPQALATGFFAFANPAPDRMLASWFLAAQPGNELVAAWAARAVAYWRNRAETNDYFWLHHEFGNLYASDALARRHWNAVPRISADGPHAIQRVGMFAPTEQVFDAVDWTTPVFKLTHRIDEPGYRAGTLAYDLLHRHFEPDRPAAVQPSTRKVLHVAGLKVGTENLGDHLQIKATDRLLKRLGYHVTQRIDRDDEIANAPTIGAESAKIGVLLNGWFKTNPAQWPPHPAYEPIYAGFHIRLFQAPTLVSEDALAHYTQYGPIGCRDRYTLALLQAHGVDAYLSHYISLIYPRRLPDPAKQTEIMVVSRDERILEFLPPNIRNERFLSQYSGSPDFEENMARATALLSLYRDRARLIVTTMLHCALPAIAMGIPVVVFYPPNQGEAHRSDLERFSSLAEMIRVFNPTEASLVDWRGYTADVGDIKLMLVDRLAALAQQRWGSPSLTPLGPIAPASHLPVPTADTLQQLSLDPRRLAALAAQKAPDRMRWRDPASYRSEWAQRAELASRLMIQSALRSSAAISAIRVTQRCCE